MISNTNLIKKFPDLDMGIKTKKNQYSIGIAIRTWNEANYLGRCITLLKKQKSDLISSMEIMVIDSYSTDGTIEISEREGCTLIEIPKEKFNYGGSLNTGFKALNKDLIVSLSAHAIPRSEDFLHELIKPFSDPEVAGTYSRQDPWPDALFLEKVRIAKTFDSQPRAFTEAENPDLHFSNVASCVRKSCWKKKHFLEIPSSEDFFWAKDMLNDGFKILYVPAVSVYHSHNDSCKGFARRFYNILQNDLVNNKRTSLKETIRVIRAAASHIKYIVRICTKEQGRAEEKLIAINRSLLEFLFIIKYHFKYKSNTKRNT